MGLRSQEERASLAMAFRQSRARLAEALKFSRNLTITHQPGTNRGGRPAQGGAEGGVDPLVLAPAGRGKGPGTKGDGIGEGPRES